MKKFLGVILALSLVVTAFPMSSFAEEMDIATKDAIKETSQTAPVETQKSAKDIVMEAYAKIAEEGKSDAEVTATANITRGMLVSLLYNISGEEYISEETVFSDVPTDKYYCKAVAWAYDAKIIVGHSKTIFAPEDHVTREQFAVILYNFAQYKDMDVSNIEGMAIKEFEDYDKISSWAEKAIRYCINMGVITAGEDGKFDPQGNENISDATGMIVKFLGE